NAKGTRLATAGVDCRVRVWSWPGCDLLTQPPLEGHPDKDRACGGIQCLAFSADGSLLASGSQSCVVVWDVATLRPLHPPLPTAGGGLLAFTPTGRPLVAAPHNFPAGQERAFTCWDVETGDPSGKPREVPGPPNVMVGRLSRDGRTVYLMSYLPSDPRLGAYDTVSGQRRFPDPGPVCSVALSPDGRTLPSGGGDGRVCLWDLATPPDGALAGLRRLTGHRKQIVAVAFSPDSRLLASSSVDGTIRLSDVATGRVVRDLSTDPSQLAPVPLAFSPDGETLAPGRANAAVKLSPVTTRHRNH